MFPAAIDTIMPSLCINSLQPQLVLLFEAIRIRAPVQHSILLGGVFISLGISIICILKRKRRHGNRFGLADTERPWDGTREHEKRLHIRPASLPWPPKDIITRIVTSKEDTGGRHQQDESTITTMSEPPQNENLEIQRRKSYTNKIVEGARELNGEILVAEGWRRHTKVFGGSGVCQACVESEERMKAMNLSLNRVSQGVRSAGPSGGKSPPGKPSQEQSS